MSIGCQMWSEFEGGTRRETIPTGSARVALWSENVDLHKLWLTGIFPTG